MQYPWRRASLVQLALLASMAGCLDAGPDGETRDDCELASDPKVLDIELSGLDDTRSYRFVVEAEGAFVTLIRTPDQHSTFGEAQVPDGGALVASLDPDTLRVFLDGMAGNQGPGTVRVTAWTRAGLVAESTFMPAYEQAVPVAGDCFSTITEHLAFPPHE
jgi:hypothetical protein